MVELEHVAQIVRAGKSVAPERGRRDGVVMHRLAERSAQPCRHFRARQVLACNPDILADVSVACLEDAKRAPPDVLCRDTRQLPVAHRQCESEAPVRFALGSHSEIDQVVPVERGAKERGGNAGCGELRVRFALGVEVRHLVLAHQRRHAIVAQRNRVATVFEGGPDHMLHARRTRG